MIICQIRKLDPSKTHKGLCLIKSLKTWHPYKYNDSQIDLTDTWVLRKPPYFSYVTLTLVIPNTLDLDFGIGYDCSTSDLIVLKLIYVAVESGLIFV